MKPKSALVRAILALFSILIFFVPLEVQSQDTDPPSYIAPPLRGLEAYRPEPIDRSALPRSSQSNGLKAVAIVGHVEGAMDILKGDMNVAVNTLQDHGVTVETFYYGERTFDWSDIVSAATDAHFLLYMGHGVYWGGACNYPTLVGGFYLGPQFVHPDDIRDDLAGRMAEDSVVILSHVCYSAGNTACDEEGEPSQAEAARRVRMYAAPFVDIGMQAYFANNFNTSASDFADHLLADIAVRQSVGDIFKSVFPYDPSEFHDLSYPDTPGYDLWLSGRTGHWSDAFVGIPDYVFSGDQHAELGPLPSSLAFTYNLATTQLSPTQHLLTPTNVGSDDPLTWNVTAQGDWFTVSPSDGSTPDDQITVTPVTATISGLPVGHYTGAFTVTVTDPANTANGEQRVDLGLDVVVPRLGNLPRSLRFTYFFSETMLIPPAHYVTPENVGSDDTLSWELSHSGDWFTLSTTSGQTSKPFTITPTGLTMTEAVTYTDALTVTVIAPSGTEDAVQVIDLSLEARPGEPIRVYMPLTIR